MYYEDPEINDDRQYAQYNLDNNGKNISDDVKDNSTEEKIRHQLKINKIKEMKKPTILINTNDFDLLKNELQFKIKNYKIGNNPTYQGIPIKTNDIVDKGTVMVYDDIYSEWVK